ncbi:receptor-like protein kinase FERONIA [Castanea sativa]|uniref:receptor-like protein kinase FERONIA n=1 Tax=Castanea sativa TaxID=21020 RepID=UPI003F64F80A
MEGISKLLRTSGKRRLDKTRQSYSVLPDGLCRRFSLADINTATSNFDDDLVIGEGSYGKVYKGFIDHPTTTSVAIKRVDIKSRQIFDELRTELLLLCQLHHPNLVPLIGYYLDDQQVILVYEFIPNGTLSKYLHFQEHVCDPLSWKQRLQICIGVARALHYLHSGVKHKYSCRSAVRRELETDEAHLATRARKCIQEGTIYRIIDPYLKGKIAPQCFKIYMDIANSCVRNKGKDRPTITEVEVVLEHASELQESADAAREDVDPSGGDQYKYPIVEYTRIASPPEFEGSHESERSISDSIAPHRLNCPWMPP